MKKRCPVCKCVVKVSTKEKSPEANFFPFCSRRCKLVDLGAWLDTKYKLISDVPDKYSDSSTNG